MNNYDEIIMKKDCNGCICLQCGNDDCFLSMCKGASVELEFYKVAIENCYKEKCKEFSVYEDD